MQLARGDMWSAFEDADLFLITTNSVVNRHGALVMGAGIVRQARERYPGLDAALGSAVLQAGDRYGLLVSPRWFIPPDGSGPTAKLGAFQTKVHWREDSSPELIAFSTGKLLAWCREHPAAQVHLNLPGVGLGGLSREQVLPVLASLPDSVTVWEYHAP